MILLIEERGRLLNCEWELYMISRALYGNLTWPIYKVRDLCLETFSLLFTKCHESWKTKCSMSAGVYIILDVSFVKRWLCVCMLFSNKHVVLRRKTWFGSFCWPFLGEFCGDSFLFFFFFFLILFFLYIR